MYPNLLALSRLDNELLVGIAEDGLDSIAIDTPDDDIGMLAILRQETAEVIGVCLGIGYDFGSICPCLKDFFLSGAGELGP